MPNIVYNMSSYLAQIRHFPSPSAMLRISNAAPTFCYILLCFVVSPLLHAPRFIVLLQLLGGLFILCAQAGFFVGGDSADSRSEAAAIPRRAAIRPASPLIAYRKEGSRRAAAGGGGAGKALGPATYNYDVGSLDMVSLQQFRRYGDIVGRRRDQEQQGGEGEGEDDVEELHRRAEAYIHKVRRSFKTER